MNNFNSYKDFIIEAILSFESSYTGFYYLYSRQQNYVMVIYGLIEHFYHLILVISIIRPKDHDLTNIYFTE